MYLPTDIANLYEKATLHNDRNALEELENLANTGDNFAKGFMIRILTLGQCGIQPDLYLARAFSEGMFSWLEAIIQSANDLAVMIGQFLVGLFYSEGLDTVGKDEKEAIRWYRLSADRHYSMAQAYLGYCYYIGKGVIMNHEESVRWYRKAAEQGHAGAQSNLGLCYENGHGIKLNASEAVYWYKLAAEQDYGIASYNLAFCYERGFGISKEIHQAFYYYLLAIRQGYEMKSEFRIGLFFQENLLFINDLKVQTIKQQHFQSLSRAQASNGGGMTGKIGLNSTSFDGDIGEFPGLVNLTTSSSRLDLAQYSQYQPAPAPAQSQSQQQGLTKGKPLQKSSQSFHASTDHSDNSQSLDSIPVSSSPPHQQQQQQQQQTAALQVLAQDSQYYKDQHQKNTQSNEHEAFYWFFSSAIKGYGDSQVKVGQYFEYGIAASLNLAKAFHYYELSAKQGNVNGKYHLAVCASMGIGCEPDYEKALVYYHECAKEGHVIAQNNLAYFYKHGLGVEKNLLEAVKWYQKAADKGYAPAQYNLAFLYEKKGTEINQQWIASGQMAPMSHHRMHKKSSQRIQSMASLESLQTTGLGGGAKPIKLQDIISLYVAAAQGGEPRAIKALERVKA
jgi:TPR repeat protein